VIVGLFLAEMASRISIAGARAVFVSFVVAFATIFLLGIPNQLAESAWDAGLHFPRLLDWSESRALAEVIKRNNLSGHLLSVYENFDGPFDRRIHASRLVPWTWG
jgi:hypothetical protein